MFERFTPDAIKVIMLAQEEARRLGHNRVGTEQILLGVLGVKNSIAAKTLAKHDLTLAKGREAVLAAIGRGSGFVAVEIPFTDSAKTVLELSWAASCNRFSNSITVEHLLLGLLEVEDDIAAPILRDCCGSLETVKTDLLATMGET